MFLNGGGGGRGGFRPTGFGVVTSQPAGQEKWGCPINFKFRER